MSKSKIFYLILLSFIAGICISEFFVFNYYIFIFFLPFILVTKNKKVIFLICLFFLLGVCRFQLSLPNLNDEHNIYFYNGQAKSFAATIEQVDKRTTHQKLIVRVLDDDIDGRVLVSTGLYPVYSKGDVLNIECNLEYPKNFDDFLYDKYLSLYDIYSVCSFVKVYAVNSGNLNILDSVKNRLSDSLNRSISEPHVSIVQAMTLANRRGIDNQTSTIISNAGLSHIIAISGMHITIMVMVVMLLANWLGLIRQKAFWFTLITIFLYVLMIGYPASAVRGAIMGMVILLANKVGRLSSSINALLLATSAMLVINPKLIFYDIGFQLSFMAVIGILYIMPILSDKFSKLPELGPFKNIILITLSAQITTLPIVAYYFKGFSVLSVLSNILVLPILPLVMVWSILVSIVGMVFQPLAQITGYVSYLLVEYILQVSKFVSSINILYIDISVDSFYVLVVVYMLVFLLVKKLSN